MFRTPVPLWALLATASLLVAGEVALHFFVHGPIIAETEPSYDYDPVLRECGSAASLVPGPQACLDPDTIKQIVGASPPVGVSDAARLNEIDLWRKSRESVMDSLQSDIDTTNRRLDTVEIELYAIARR